MSGMKRYIAWCEDNEYTNEYGEVVSMQYADEYMRRRHTMRSIDNSRLKRQWLTLKLTHYLDL